MSINNKILEFGFNGQLPRVYEVVNCIISVTPGAGYHRSKRPESAVVKAAIHGCSTKLKELWESAFGTGVIKSLTAIKHQIRKELHKYSTYMCKQTDIGTLKNSWRLTNTKLFDCLAPNINVNEFDEIERKFYHDQKELRILFLSEEIDIDGERIIKQIAGAKNCVEAELKDV